MYAMPAINRTRGKSLMKSGGARTEQVELSTHKISKVSILATVLLTAALLTAYFFLVTSFFQGWQKAKFFDDVPDLVFATVSITLLFYVLRMKRSPGDMNLIIGLSLVSLDKLIEVVLQELQALTPGESLEVVLWAPPIIMLGLGFLFIVQYFGERVK
jgi:hypothetical protein